MDSSPEMDKFGISEEDYEYMFDPLKRRGFTSKKQQIYGIFASDSDSETDAKSGMSSMASIRKRKGSNYSGPITFVSGGIKEGSKPVESVEVDDSTNIEISDEEEDKRWFSGNKSPEQLKVANPSVNQARRAKASSSQAFGSWERHTKGIGMKLLQKMGFKAGEGLGKEGQGIVAPVEAIKRVGKGAVGSVGPEVAPAPRRGGEAASIPETKVNTGFPRYKKKAPGSNGSSVEKRSERTVYLTADELIASVSPVAPTADIKARGPFMQNNELSKVKVIDMTQREQRVYDGYAEALSKSSRYSRHVDDAIEDAVDSEAKKRERRIEGHFFEVPVLCHNIDLIIKTTEDEIRRLDRGARYEEDRMAGLHHEIERLSKVVDKAAFDVDELDAALQLISQFESTLKRDELSANPEACSSWVNRIRRECSGLPELPALLAAVARPLLDSILTTWRPLVNPGFGVSVLTGWRVALGDSSAFEILLHSSWMPPVRRAIISEWDPHDCECLLTVFEAWQSLLPEDLLQQDLLDALVLPKLREAVDKWNPLTDRIPIHTWLHPWLPWFGGASRLAAIHELVLHKLAACLTNWHPSDASASSVLMPWRNVIPMAQMTAFLNRNVVPKLALVMQNFQINPADQKMEPWNWVMRWLDIIDPAVIADLLERFFLPRWLHCLSDWLIQGADARKCRSPNTGQIFGEIGAWYSGWKSQMPSLLVDYPSVKDAFAKALSLMEKTMRGLPSEPMQPFRRMPTPQIIPPGGFAHRPPFIAPQPPMVSMNLREQVEQTATRRGFLFHPVANRFYEGKQVYRLESHQVYFDRNVAYCFNSYDSLWHPVSFSELMAMAE